MTWEQVFTIGCGIAGIYGAVLATVVYAWQRRSGEPILKVSLQRALYLEGDRPVDRLIFRIWNAGVRPIQPVMVGFDMDDASPRSMNDPMRLTMPLTDGQVAIVPVPLGLVDGDPTRIRRAWVEDRTGTKWFVDRREVAAAQANPPTDRIYINQREVDKAGQYRLEDGV